MPKGLQVCSLANRGMEVDIFCCPITQELLVDPVAASDGHTVRLSCFPKNESHPWLLV